MIFGVIPWEDLGIGLPTLWWWFPEMTASFLLFSILIGLVGRMGEGEFTSTFVDGARDLLGVALIIGIARGITVIMNNGLITDTVLNCGRAGAVADLGGVAFINLMYVAVPAAVVPHPVVVRPGDGGDADHGAAGQLRGRAGAARGHGLPDRPTACSTWSRPPRPWSWAASRSRASATAPGSFVWPVLLLLAVLIVLVLSARRSLLRSTRQSPSAGNGRDERGDYRRRVPGATRRWHSLPGRRGARGAEGRPGRRA